MKRKGIERAEKRWFTRRVVIRDDVGNCEIICIIISHGRVSIVGVLKLGLEWED